MRLPGVRVFELVSGDSPWHQIRVHSYLSPRGIITASLALIAAVVLSSCGTIAGIGHDVRYVGDAVEKAAR
jgi:predicted small secreted protein